MRYVRYVGLAHQRMITAADWARVGISAATVQWDAFNGFAVPADQFTEDQMKKAIDPDLHFVVTGDEEGAAFEPDLSAKRAMTPQEFERPPITLLDSDQGSNASVPGSESSTKSSPKSTGRGTAGHDE